MRPFTLKLSGLDFARFGEVEGVEENKEPGNFNERGGEEWRPEKEEGRRDFKGE